MTFSVLLHNIRSIHNVGSIFRTADACGFSQVYLAGYTPTPIDRFGRVRTDLAKVSLGAEKFLQWKHFDSLDTAIQQLDSHETKIIALEQHPQSIPYDEYSIDPTIKELIVVLGEEIQGIESKYLTQVDDILEIPMKGKKESLNVSVAFGVLAYELIKPQ